MFSEFSICFGFFYSRPKNISISKQVLLIFSNLTHLPLRPSSMEVVLYLLRMFKVILRINLNM